MLCNIYECVNIIMHIKLEHINTLQYLWMFWYIHAWCYKDRIHIHTTHYNHRHEGSVWTCSKRSTFMRKWISNSKKSFTRQVFLNHKFIIIMMLHSIKAFSTLNLWLCCSVHKIVKRFPLHAMTWHI